MSEKKEPEENEGHLRRMNDYGVHWTKPPQSYKSPVEERAKVNRVRKLLKKVHLSK